MPSSRDDSAYSTPRVRRSLIHFAIGKSASAVVGLGLLLLLVRQLDQPSYASLVVMMALLEAIQLGSSLGCFPAVTRYVPELHAKRQGRTLVLSILAISAWRLATLATACAVYALIAPAFANFLGYGNLGLFRLYALVILLEGLARYVDVVFEALLMQGAGQVSILVRNGLRLVGLGTVLIAADPLSLYQWILIEVVASAVGLLVATAMLSHALVGQWLRDTQAPTRVEYRRWFSYAWPAFLAQLFGLAQGPDSAKLLLAKLTDVAQTAAFGLAAALSAMAQRYLPVFLLIGMVRPLFVARHVHAGNNDRLVELANLVFKLNVFVIAPGAVLVGVLGDPIGRLISGGRFPDISYYLFAFCVLLIAQTMHTVLGLIALALEESKAGLRGTLFGFLGVAVAVISIDALGPIGVFLGLLASEIIWCAVMHRALRKRGLRLFIDWRGLATIAVLSVFAGSVAWFVYGAMTAHQSLRVAAATVAMALVYAVLARAFRPFTSAERELINRLLPRPIFVW